MSSVTFGIVTGTCQPMNLPSLASDTSTSRGNSGIQIRNWMNLACRPYLTMMDADEEPRVSEPSRKTKPHDSDTFNTHPRSNVKTILMYIILKFKNALLTFFYFSNNSSYNNMSLKETSFLVFDPNNGHGISTYTKFFVIFTLVSNSLETLQPLFCSNIKETGFFKLN